MKLAAIALALSSLQCGGPFADVCAGQAETWGGVVNAWFRDPGQVTLETVDGRALVPAGVGAAEADLQSGTLGLWVTATYTARVVREANGALAVEWVTDLPMPRGRRVVFVLPDGQFSGLGVAPGHLDTLGFPAALRRDRLELTVCVWLDDTVRFKRRGGYVPQLGVCDTLPDWQPMARTAPRFRISTPWSNVVSLSHDTRDNLGDNDVCTTRHKSEILYPPSPPPARDR